MNSFALTKALKNHDPIRDDLEAAAERELGVLFNAVTELFGAEQAKVSAEEWLRELTERSVIPVSTRQWRQLSVEVIARLASRVHVSSEATTAH